MDGVDPHEPSQLDPPADAVSVRKLDAEERPDLLDWGASKGPPTPPGPRGPPAKAVMSPDPPPGGEGLPRPEGSATGPKAPGRSGPPGQAVMSLDPPPGWEGLPRPGGSA